jgi:hypothetical protein
MGYNETLLSERNPPMLAYEINHHNVAMIATLGGSVVVMPEDERNDIVRYFIDTPTGEDNLYLLKEEFERDFVVKKAINEALGRFIIEKR